MAMQIFAGFLGNSNNTPTTQDNSNRVQKENVQSSNHSLSDEDDDSSPGASHSENSSDSEGEESQHNSNLNANESLLEEASTVLNQVEKTQEEIKIINKLNRNTEQDKQSPTGGGGASTSRRRTIISRIHNIAIWNIMGTPASKTSAPSAAQSPQVASVVQEISASERLAQENALKEKLKPYWLENEPVIAKEVRSTLKIAENVICLLEQILHNSSFIPQEIADIRTCRESCKGLYDAEVGVAQSATTLERFDAAVALAYPEKEAPIFQKFSTWNEKLTSYVDLWEEVLQNYSAPTAVYPFSMQPIYKLMYIYDVFTALIEFKKQFNTYMMNPTSQIDNPVELFINTQNISNDSELQSRFLAFIGPHYQARDQALAENQGTLTVFTALLELFSARVIILVKILDGVKTENEEMTRMQQNGFRLNAQNNLPSIELKVAELVEDEQENEDTSAVNKLLEKDASDELNAFTEAKTQRDAIIETVNKIATAIVGYEAQVELYQQQLNQELLQAAQEELSKNKEMMPHLTKICQDCTTQYNIAHESLNKAKEKIRAQIKDQKEQKAQEAEEEAKRQVEQARLREQNILQAKEATTRFFTDYALRSDPNSRTLRLTSPIKLPLFSVSTAMLKLWLYDQQEHLSEDTLLFLANLITPQIRELNVTLELRSNYIFELRLQDIHQRMFENFFITMDGSLRGTLMNEESLSTSAKINRDYEEMVNQINGLQDIIKPSPSEISLQAVALLAQIVNSRVENTPHREFTHMNKTTFALFGLYLLLYLQDAPTHNFQSALSPKLPGGGSRFLRGLIMNVEKDLGYDLRACKMIYDEMLLKKEQEQTKTSSVDEKTTRSSLISLPTLPFESASLAASSGTQISDHLDYLFSEQRTVKDLEECKEKNLMPQDYLILVEELSGRYLNRLRDLVIINESEISEIQRKRLNRVAQLVEQLPYEHRFELMKFQVVQLVMLRYQIIKYKRMLSGERKTILGSMIAKLSSTIKQGADARNLAPERKTEKLAFLRVCFLHILQMYLAETHLPDTITSGVTLPVVEAYNLSKNATKLEPFNEDPTVLVDWINNFILDDESINMIRTLMWLTDRQLSYIFASTGIQAGDIRQRVRIRPDFFEHIDYEIEGHLVQTTASKISTIEYADEMFILLVCQSAVLQFGQMMQETNNFKIISLASQHSWFLQLRFLEAILIDKKILTKYDSRYDAATNCVREREALKVFNQMMNHLDDLPEWLETCFSGTRTDLREQISQKSRHEKIKLVFVLIVHFFAVVFKTLSTVSEENKRSLSQMVQHFISIKKMMGFELNGEYEALLANLALILLSLRPDFLDNNPSRIVVTNQRFFTLHTVKDKEDSRFDFFFNATPVQINLPELTIAKKFDVLSNSKIGTFLGVVSIKDKSESILLESCLNITKSSR